MYLFGFSHDKANSGSGGGDGGDGGSGGGDGGSDVAGRKACEQSGQTVPHENDCSKFYM